MCSVYVAYIYMTHGSRVRASDPLVLVWYRVVNTYMVLGTILRLSGRAANTHNHRPSSLVPFLIFFNINK